MACFAYIVFSSASVKFTAKKPLCILPSGSVLIHLGCTRTICLAVPDACSKRAQVYDQPLALACGNKQLPHACRICTCMTLHAKQCSIRPQLDSVLSLRAQHCAHEWRRAASASMRESAQRPPVGKLWVLSNGGAVVQGQIVPEEQSAIFCADLQGGHILALQQCWPRLEAW